MRLYHTARGAALFGLWLICGEGLWRGLFAAGEPFKFYTYQSNLLAFLMLSAELVLLAVSLFQRRESGKLLRLPAALKGWVAVTVLLTFFTYWTVLNSFGAPLSRQDAIIHFIVPLGTVAEYLLFHPYGRHRWFDPLWWCVSPVAYCAFVAVMYFTQNYFNGDYFPYFFMDGFSHGWPRVVTTGICLLAFYLACGYLFYLWDKLLCFIKQKLQNNKHA